MFKDKDYVVKDDEVLIVDEFTGRIMPGRRYSDGCLLYTSSMFFERLQEVLNEFVIHF